MSDNIEPLLNIIKTKVDAVGGIDVSVKFVVEGYTPIIVDQAGVRQEDGEAAATLTAKLETFLGLFTGKLNPAMAFMSGKIKVEGDTRVAAKLRAVF